MNAKSIDAVQGVLALAGITFGVIPLVRSLFTDEPGGLLSWLPGGESATLPVVVTVLAVLLIGGLELGKRSRT